MHSREGQLSSRIVPTTVVEEAVAVEVVVAVEAEVVALATEIKEAIDMVCL